MSLAGGGERLLVTGCNGQVGWELRRSLQPLGEVIALDRSMFDLGLPGGLDAGLEVHRPTVIVNAAAYTAVDAAEDDEATALRVNGDAVAVLAAWARRNAALLVHYSTDYVLDGSGDAPRDESAPTAPLNAYGRSKLAGERAALAAGTESLVLRTSWVYAARGANFLLTMLRLAREREQLRVVADQVGAPTSARLIADATAQAIRVRLAERRDARAGARAPAQPRPPLAELVHLAARGETSWHGFASAAIEEARRCLPEGSILVRNIEPIATADWPARASRPLNSRLAVDRIEARFGLRMPHWTEGMRLCIDDWLSSNLQTVSKK